MSGKLGRGKSYKDTDGHRHMPFTGANPLNFALPGKPTDMIMHKVQDTVAHHGHRSSADSKLMPARPMIKQQSLAIADRLTEKPDP